MRCLQCGNQLALLKKFTDGEFCSADHRHLYHEEMQRLTAESVLAIGTRLRSKLRRAALPPPSEPLLFDDFVAMQRCEIRDWQRSILPICGQLIAFPPSFELPVQPPAGARRRIRAAGVLRSPIRVANWRVAIRRAVAAPEVSACPPSILGFASSTGMPALLEAADVLRGGAASPAASQGSHRFTSGEAPTICSWGAHAVLPALAAPSESLAPVPLDKFFRPRPRGPMPGAALGAGFASAGTAETWVVRPSVPSRELPASEAAPPICTRPAPVSPRGPMTDGALRAVLALAPAREDVVAESAMPRFIPELGELRPSESSRFFRPRPRGPVADPAIAASVTALAAGDFSASAAIPALFSAPAPAAPVQSHALFRMRPRSGVLDPALAGSVGAQIESAAVAGAAAIPPALLGWGGFEPKTCTKLFRPRPRGPVGDARLMGGSCAPVSPVMAPVQPQLLPYAGLCEPARINKLFRPRPKGPVADKSLFAAATAAESLRVFESKAILPEPQVLPLQGAPKRIDKLFRPRPRGPVQSIRRDPDFVSPAPVNGLPGPVFGGSVLVSYPDASGFRPSGTRSAHDLTFHVKQELAGAARMMGLPRPTATRALALSASGVSNVPSLAGFLITFPNLVLAPAPSQRLIPENPRKDMVSSGAGIAGSVLRVWSRIPANRRWIAFAGPVVIGMALHSTMSKPAVAQRNVAMADVSGSAGPLREAVAGPLDNLKLTMRQRAAVELSDDFSSGLHSWSGKGDWSGTWKYDERGGIIPGAPAFLLPSQKLADYHLEFTGTIEKKALGWLVRAADVQNYYAVKLQILKPGPMPKVAVVRYPVIGGKEGKKTTTELPFPVTADTVYRVAMDMTGESFTLTIQGKVVDFWSDSQLKTGGAGFFSTKGEQSRIQSVHITHQNDALGRVFAKLSPGIVEAKDGSSK